MVAVTELVWVGNKKILIASDWKSCPAEIRLYHILISKDACDKKIESKASVRQFETAFNRKLEKSIFDAGNGQLKEYRRKNLSFQNRHEIAENIEENGEPKNCHRNPIPV